MKRHNQQVKNEENLQQEDPLKIIQVLNNETRFSILLYTLIYHELTLEKLSELLGKSKSTIHHHMQMLLDNGLAIENVKPGSKTKYYQIIKQNIPGSFAEPYNLNTLVNLSDEERAKYVKIILGIFKPISTLVTNTLNLVVEYVENISENLDSITMEALMTGFKENEALNFNILNISERAFDFYQEEFKRFVQKIRSHKDIHSTEIEEAPYIVYMLSIPIKNILETKYGRKTPIK